MSNTIKMSSDEIAKIVVEKFVVGADATALKKLERAAKGGDGFFNRGSFYSSDDKNYTLMVGSPFFFFMKSKDVSFWDIEGDVIYEMKPSSEWPRFYQLIREAIAEELNK